MGMGLKDNLAKIVAITGLVAVMASSSVSAATKRESSKTSAPSKSVSSYSATHFKKSSKSKKGKKSKKSRRGQQAIDSSRTQQIQQALIEQHYMDGEPSGKWDDATQTALRKYQGDNGWQTKTVPDSRALIKLGLGPSKDGLLNPETAMTSGSEHPATSAKPVEAAPAEKSQPR